MLTISRSVTVAGDFSTVSKSMVTPKGIPFGAVSQVVYKRGEWLRTNLVSAGVAPANEDTRVVDLAGDAVGGQERGCIG